MTPQNSAKLINKTGNSSVWEIAKAMYEIPVKAEAWNYRHRKQTGGCPGRGMGGVRDGGRGLEEKGKRQLWA